MNRSLDVLVDNLSQINDKACKKCKERIKATQYYKFNKLDRDKLMCKCLECNDIPYNSLQSLIDKFSNTHRLSKKNGEFILLLRKGVYPYEYMDNWNKFNESAPLEKDKYCSELTMSGISHKDLKDVEKVCSTFKIKDLGIYHDLYVQFDTLLLKMCLKLLEKHVLKRMN